jgi:ppGpp synthetase/RelA/SpoT-type nucleotidyltranferase
MKVDERIRAEFKRQQSLAERLKERVDDDFVNRSDSWHYESRVKSEESFALKIEAGRVRDPAAVEDVFGCVLVVRNALELPAAIDFVRVLYGEPDEQRPASLERTRKSPSDFLFDDVRLYLRYSVPDYLPQPEFVGVKFEIQIRTFLQHAWAIATHDVVYKADDVNWRRERVAHQIRATLEQAEVAIERMSELQETKALPQASSRFDDVNAIINLLRDEWPADQLPHDLRRLSESIAVVARAVDVSIPDGLSRLLADGRAALNGAHNLNWSPYRSTLQYAATSRPQKLRTYLRDNRKWDPLFVYPEVLEQLGVPPSEVRRGVSLRADS